MKKYLLLFLLFPLNIYAQDDSQDTARKQSFLQRYQAKQAIKEKEGRFMITPVLGPGYTPELGFSLAGGALLSFKTDRSDTALQRSSIPVTVGYSTTGAFFASAKASTFWHHDKIRGYADFWVKNMPDNYFGIGYDNGHNVIKSDSTTKYNRTWFQINPKVLWQFQKNWLIGGVLDINYTKGSNACQMVASDPNYAKYNDKPFNAGLGIEAQIDSRDVAVSAWSGWFVDLQAILYGSYLGGDNNYEVASIDIRRYIQLFKPGQILALQLKGRFAMDNVPYGEMSQLGTPFDLRGYLWGQYRDKCMLFGIAEYRHSFYKANGERSKHEAAGWIGAGSIAPDMAFKNWLPNCGIGYRYEVQPRMALRLDLGIGMQNIGFYFNFNEAY